MQIQIQNWNEVSDIKLGDFIIQSDGTVYVITKDKDGYYYLVNLTANWIWYKNVSLDNLLVDFMSKEKRAFRIVKGNHMALTEMKEFN